MEATVSVSRDIAATPRWVWNMVSDLPRMGEWSPEAQGGVWVDEEAGLEVGAVFEGANSNGKKKWKTKVTVVECDPPNRLVFRMRVGPLGGSDWVYDIEPTNEGCRVTESWIDNRSWLFVKIGLLISGVADRATHNRATMEATLDAVAAAI